MTLAIGTNPSSGSVLGTISVSAVNGVATFNNVTVDKVGNGSEPASVTIRMPATTPATNNFGRLLFGAPVRVRVAGLARYLQARLTTSRRSNIVATMTGRGLRTPHRWRFAITSGA